MKERIEDYLLKCTHTDKFIHAHTHTHTRTSRRTHHVERLDLHVHIHTHTHTPVCGEVINSGESPSSLCEVTEASPCFTIHCNSNSKGMRLAADPLDPSHSGRNERGFLNRPSDICVCVCVCACSVCVQCACV